MRVSGFVFSFSIKATVASLILMLFSNGIIYSAANAGTVKMKQEILPAAFIYLDKKGNVERFWSNAVEGDSIYIVKVYDFRKRELKSGEKILKLCQQEIQKESAAKMQAINFKDSRSHLTVDFISIGNNLEEIRTMM